MSLPCSSGSAAAQQAKARPGKEGVGCSADKDPMGPRCGELGPAASLELVVERPGRTGCRRANIASA